MVRVHYYLSFNVFKFKASITQLVRVLGCGSKSRRFEPCYSPNIIFFVKKLLKALNGYLNIKNYADVISTKVLNKCLIFRNRKIEFYLKEMYLTVSMLNIKFSELNHLSN